MTRHPGNSNQEDLEHYVKNQRRNTWLIFGLLGLLVALAALGFNIDLQLGSDTKNPEVKETARNSSVPFKPQSKAEHTQSVAFVVRPMPDKWETLPESKVWLARLTEELVKDFCDENRAIENADFFKAQNMLPRVNLDLDDPKELGVSMRQLCEGSSSQNVVVIDLQSEPGWKLQAYQYERSESVKQGLTRKTMPENDVLTTLIQDLEKVCEGLTGYDLQTKNVLTRNDDAAKAFAELLKMLSEDRAAGFPDERENDDASGEKVKRPRSDAHDAALQKVLKLDPEFRYASYRRIEHMTRGLDSLARDLTRERRVRALGRIAALLDAGVQEKRLINLYAVTVKAVVGSQSKQEREWLERAEKLIVDLNEREPLFMTAAYTRSLYLRADPTEGEQGTVPTQKQSSANESSDDAKNEANRFEPIKLMGAIAVARHMIEKYPSDGRFHIQLARDLAINSRTAQEAIEVARTARNLRPWDATPYYHEALAYVQLATLKGPEGEWDQERCDDAWTKSIEAITSGWQKVPNELSGWLELLAKAITKDAKSYSEDTVFTAYQASKISIAFSNFSSAGAQEVLKKMPRDFKRRARDGVVTLAEQARTNPFSSEIPNPEFLLLADVALVIELFQQYGQQGFKPSDLTIAETKRLNNGLYSLNAYRNKIGGRATRVEELYNQLRRLGLIEVD